MEARVSIVLANKNRKCSPYQVSASFFDIKPKKRATYGVLLQLAERASSNLVCSGFDSQGRYFIKLKRGRSYPPAWQARKSEVGFRHQCYFEYGSNRYKTSSPELLAARAYEL